MRNNTLAGSFRHAWAGIRLAASRERNFRFHLGAGALAMLCCAALRVRTVYFAWVVLSVFLVLSLELVNTAVETAVDLACGDKPHPLAKAAKDAAAGAVLLAAVQAVLAAAVVAVSVFTRWWGA